MATVNINGKEVDIKQFRNDWALALMSKGIIVKLTVSKWTGTSSLLYSDLGLKFKDDETHASIKKYIILGREKLLPPEIMSEISNIQSRAREVLGNNSFDTIWGKFVPYTAFTQWQIENEEIKKNFELATKVMIERYDEMISIIRKEYRNIARDTWNRLYPNDNNNPPESFIEDYVSKIVSKIPNRMDLQNTFSYKVTYFQIPLPSFVEENLKKTEEIHLQREQQQVASQLEIEAKRRITEEYIQKKQEYVDGFLSSTVSSMRGYIAELCDSILENIYKTDKESIDIPKKQREKIKTLIRKVNLLNFYNDPDILTMTKELELEVNKFKGERNKNIVAEKLQKFIEIKDNDFIPTDYNPLISGLEL